MCFATSNEVPEDNKPDRLSVPFSSGCALRLCKCSWYACSRAALSVPFSSGCALRLVAGDAILRYGIVLSVPFSSGCALRLFPEIQRVGTQFFTFSSLLIGMCFATEIGDDFLDKCVPLSVPFSSGCALRQKSRRQ